MATSGYGATAPGALDPFSIESTLANIVGTNNPAAAGGALDLYQLKNQVSQSNYGYDQAQQHEYAKKQLAQQLYETQLKEVHNLLKTPGGAHLLGPGGIPGMGLGVDPSVMSGVIGAADTAQGAENFSKAGSGFSNFSEGGLLVNPGDIPGLPPGMQGTLTDNAKVRAAQIQANAHLAAARLHGASEDKVTLSGPIGIGVDAVNASLRTPRSKTQEGLDYITNLQRAADEKRRGVAPPGAVVEPQTTGPAGPSPATPPLPVAKQDTPAPATPKVPGLAAAPATPKKPAYTELTAGPVAQDAQNKTMVQMENVWTKDPAYADMAADIKAGMRGGKYTNYQLPDGRFAVKGAGPNIYIIPPQKK